MTNVTVKDVLSFRSVHGKKYIVRQAYDLFYRHAKKRFITLSTTLPYSTNDDEPYLCCHVQVASEHYRSIYYDIVYQFFTSSTITPKTYIRIFSNCPAFVYQLAYIFHKHDALLFPHLYPLPVLSIPPRKTNPHYHIDIDKYSYAALKYVLAYRISVDLVGKVASTKWRHIPSITEIQRNLAVQKSRRR